MTYRTAAVIDIVRVAPIKIPIVSMSLGYFIVSLLFSLVFDMLKESLMMIE
jgi:hypothetical protein